MAHKSQHSNSGVVFRKEFAGISAHLQADAPMRLRRFQSFIRAAVLTHSNKREAGAACLVALDGISPRSFTSIQTSGCLYAHRGMTELQWDEAPFARLERRILAARTDQALQAAGAEALQHLGAQLQHYLQSLPDYTGLTDAMQELEADAHTWWRVHLPPAIFFHLAGAQHMTALSRDCRARQDTPMVPRLLARHEPAECEVSAESFSELLDAAEHSQGSDAHPSTVNQAIAILRHHEVEDHFTRKKWMQELVALGLKAQAAGPINCLLLAWAIEMVESGTIQKTSPRPATIAEYFRIAAPPLWRGLKELPPSAWEWDQEAPEEMYRALLDGPPQPGEKRSASSRKPPKLAAALTNFHAFMMQCFDLPALHKPLSGTTVPTPVRAHVIWPHELQRAVSWAEAACADTAMGERLAVLLTLAGATGLRMGELLMLRVGDLHLIPPCGLEVEVCASHRGHRFKSPAAQRRVVVQDRDTFTRVERWLARRREQAADPQDLLFADRLEPRKVLHPHALRRRAMALLKSSTGNPQATGHDLRHSAANRWIAPVLCSSSVGEPYQLQTHATALGHTHAGTTLLSYVHSYEEATRIHLDCELQADASWTSEEAASLMGIRSEALRQRSHRSGLPASSMGWQSVLTKECAPSWEPISAPWQWEEPQAPKLGRPKGAPSAVPDVLYMLQALAAGRSTQEVAERFRVEPWWVKELETTAIDTFHHVAMQAWPVKVGFHAEKPVSLEEGLVALKVNLNKASEATGKYRCILRSFAQADDPSLLESAWKSWVRCLRGTHLAVDKKARITHLYKWLHAAGIDHRRLRICHQRNPALEQLVESEFVASFGHRPRMYPQQPREGGVRAHLQWDLQPFNDTRRSGSIEGLHAWMLAIGVLSQMEKLHGPCPAL